MRVLNNPFFFSLVARFRNLQTGQHRWVTSDTDIVLEGYPRSANTYLYRIIRAASGDKLKISHHVHRPQQVLMALRYRIPCFVIFRHPLDAIASYLVREPSFTVNRCMVDYLQFAQTTIAQVGQPGLYILTFDKIVADPKSVTHAILTKIGQSTEISDCMIVSVTKDNRINRHRSSVPNVEKEDAKQHRIAEIQAHSDYITAVELFEIARAHAWLL